MKLAILLALIISIGHLKSEEPKSFSVGWLKRGLASLIIQTTSADLKTKMPLPSGYSFEERHRYANEMSYFYYGWISGINFSVLSVSKECQSDLMFPSDSMNNIRNVMPSIMTFVVKHELPDSMQAKTALAAWYFSEHTKSTPGDKLMSLEILKMDETYKQRHDSQKASTSKP